MTDVRPAPTRAPEQLLAFALLSLQLDRYDLCWTCWDGAAEQFEAQLHGLVRCSS